MEPYLRVGVIASTHGLKGEVKVFPTTDDPERFRKLKQVILDTKREQKPLTITQVRYFKNQVILKFKEFQDINEIEKYRGCDLLVSREDAVPLKENENFIVDLIGMQVETEEGEALGMLTDVLQTGANDVYVVETKEGKELLLPAIPACILQVDVEAKLMRVHLLEGLLDL
ncbi:MAG: ribosome maturation factor RimM [Lachnospiraceae bacterium]|jgi:16S rRNA processing protein RimM|nr:ribosome maturation factor RimM [Lachnospiraceae bacterium]MCI8994782.1 ribosome maturation factor RimM [Lachnospiraceae bacterium]MCI9135259.1 ribosome maturation factor RimM [Lachnospiraceae bacterium]